MTDEDWEEATSVSALTAHDTIPAPPPEPSSPEHDAPTPLPIDVCPICRSYFNHDPACPRNKAVSP